MGMEVNARKAGSAMQRPVTMTLGRILTAVGLAAALSGGGCVYAQTRAGSDGHAIDANQQVGSSGVNPADGRLDFSRQNDIVTGNVGDGRAFQGDIGYYGVGEFNGNLGSDSLFNFQRNSLSSSPTYLNAATVNGINQANNFRVFRGFTNRAAQPLSPGLTAPGGGAYEVNNNANYGSIYTSEVHRQSFRENYQRFGQGRAGEAFPRARLNSTGIPETSETQPGSGSADDVTSDAVSRQLDQAARIDTSRMVDDLNATLRLSGNTFDPFDTGKQETDDANATLLAGQLPPSVLLGQQLQTLIDPQSGRPADPGRSQAVIDSMFKRLDKKDAQSDDAGVYDKLLSDIRSGDKNGDDSSQALPDTLETPTSQQLTEAERAYAQIMTELYGDDYQSRQQNAGEAETKQQVKGVVDQLNYDLPRIQTLASDKHTRIADLTREAEAAMVDGKYLTAEKRYEQLTREVKDDPLLRAGLVNAQLGAGMFRSAGANLRALFAQHPELIAARYDAKLLPPKDRLQWVQQELQNIIKQGEGGKDAPLLMAYLGYQADSQQVVRYGLALAQKDAPRDPLLVVVREIWLDGSDTSASDGK